MVSPSAARLYLAAPLLLCAARSRPAAAEENGFPIERLHLALDSEGVGPVEWADVLPHLTWQAGTWLLTEDDPLVIYDQSSGDTLGALVDSRAGRSLFGAIGLAGRYQAGIELPLILYQDRDSTLPGTTQPLPALSSTGLGDLRLVGKVSLLRQGRYPLSLAADAAVVLTTGGGSD